MEEKETLSMASSSTAVLRIWCRRDEHEGEWELEEDMQEHGYSWSFKLQASRLVSNTNDTIHQGSLRRRHPVRDVFSHTLYSVSPHMDFRTIFLLFNPFRNTLA
ncbi:uncharacterized protein ARMOST_21135 [Armillaria ostoyae]|uniref:Uncharacterized protein n=1 Tax=Armillaria ostoyae TaxID=47428 RepID=A0A284S996_ARMOS|nr:uncharacterized protein ARMOST_21135 [Armillaria ostoyae]